MPAIKKGKRGAPNYCSYINKVLKKVHPELSIQSKTIVTVNSFVEGLIERVTKQAARAAVAGGKGTLQAKHVQTAAKLLMPDKLSSHAVSEGSRAVARFGK